MITITREATIIVGAAAPVLAVLKSELPAGAWYEEFANFGIEDGRRFKEQASRKLAEGEKQFWVIALVAITLEAQNALLKTLEEPAAGHHFIFIVPSLADLLPTLLSRAEVIKASNFPAGESDSPGRGAAQEFFKASPEKRLEQIQKLVKLNEGTPVLTRQLAWELVNGLEATLHEEGVAAAVAPYFTELTRARDYLRDRAAMPRLILEHLALVLPVK